MSLQRQKTEKPGVISLESKDFTESNTPDVLMQITINGVLIDYFKFAIYCLMLAVPLYAVAVSILEHNWLMAFIDALIVPVGFVHGLLLLFELLT